MRVPSEIRIWLLLLVVAGGGLLVGRYALPAGLASGDDGTGGAVAAQAEGTVWTCSMHPQIRQPGPGSCPLCGMDLTPTQTGTVGDGSVRLAEGAQRIASIEVRAVARRPLEHALHAVGRIEFAEPLVAYLTARVAARVERVYADFTGTSVVKGDHLVDLYSPELAVAQQELLVAGPNAAAAREKLRLLGVTDAQLDEIVREGRPRTVLTLYAPIGGTVIEKAVREQMYLEVGDPLYTIADLSTVWMFADIYEFELPWVSVGARVNVAIEGAPGERFQGTVAFVEPVVRESTRTIRVRVNLPNPSGRLKPGMFATATIHATLGADGLAATSLLAGRWVCPMHPEVVAAEAGACPLCGMDLRQVPGAVAPTDSPVVTELPPAELLTIPSSALLDTGTRQIVWVEREPGRYEAASVRLGPRAGDDYPVLEGLTEGDRVVVRGAFLLDSQAQIEGKPCLLFPEGLDFGAGAVGARTGHEGH
ncbi:MAG: efflux RND transporter periplasmic adaptor subunit [Planctomycetota bacterium]